MPIRCKLDDDKEIDLISKLIKKVFSGEFKYQGKAPDTILHCFKNENGDILDISPRTEHVFEQIRIKNKDESTKFDIVNMELPPGTKPLYNVLSDGLFDMAASSL